MYSQKCKKIIDRKDIKEILGVDSNGKNVIVHKHFSAAISDKEIKDLRNKIDKKQHATSIRTM